MVRRALCSTLLLGAALLVGVLQGCAFLHDQVAYTSASTCMDHECTDEQGVARTQCEKECSQRYGP